MSTYQLLVKTQLGLPYNPAGKYTSVDEAVRQANEMGRHGRLHYIVEGPDGYAAGGITKPNMAKIQTPGSEDETQPTPRKVKRGLWPFSKDTGRGVAH